MEKRALLDDIFQFKDEQLISSLQEIMIIRKFNRNEIIYLEGSEQHSIIFNVKGIYRGFFLDVDGKEITDYLRNDPGTVIMSCEGLGEKAHENMQAVTDLTAIEFPLAEFTELLHKHLELAMLQNKLLLDAIAHTDRIKEVCCRMQAKEKYLWFLENYPHFDEYVRAKDIASFLDMTAVSLSRIRRIIKDVQEK